MSRFMIQALIAFSPLRWQPGNAMALINFLINLGGLLLWLNWISVPLESLFKSSSASLAGTIKRTESTSTRKSKYLFLLLGLILLRAIFYWELIPSTRWTPSLHFGIINLYFALSATHPFLEMLVYSTLSFVFLLGGFYLWLLLLSVVNANTPDTDPLQRLIRSHLKWLENWPGVIKISMPFCLGAVLWLALHPLLSRMSIIPEMKSAEQILKQAALEGMGVYLIGKYLIVGILALHLIHSYVYLGNHPAWMFVDNTARHLLYPLQWVPLRLGKVDFVPMLGIVLVLLITETCARLPARYPNLLPF